MARFITKNIVIVPFPYSNLSQAKKRPALVVANLKGNDLILCQITSQKIFKDNYSIMLNKNDFDNGGLNLDSFIRTNRLFTVDASIILYSIGVVNLKKFNLVIDKIHSIISKVNK